MANENKPEDKEAPEPMSEEERSRLTTLLSSGPKNGEKFTDAERDARKAAKQSLLANEGAKDRFQRLSTARLNEALDVIALIGNLSGPNYEYTDKQVAFIRERLHRDVDKACDRFKPREKDAPKERVEIPAD
jgi:hypothetical protein